MKTLEFTIATAKGALQIHGLEVSDKRLLSWGTTVLGVLSRNEQSSRS